MLERGCRGGGGEGRTTSGSQPNHNTYLTILTSVAGSHPATPALSHNRLMELHNKCIDKGGWALVLYEMPDGREQQSVIHKLASAPLVTTLPLAASRDKNRPARARQEEEGGLGREEACPPSAWHPHNPSHCRWRNSSSGSKGYLPSAPC